MLLARTAVARVSSSTSPQLLRAGLVTSLMHTSASASAAATSAGDGVSFGGREVVIASFARTPIARLGGGLASLTAPQLGAAAVREAISRAGIAPEDVEEAFLGNVVSAAVGQAPARQAIIYAGCPNTVPCTTVNKVCASGMKAVMLAAQSIALGVRDVMIAGGMESMSNIPYYLQQARTGYRLGNGVLIDGIVHDGLTDVYNDQHMGKCGDMCAEQYNFSREDQDAYALRSYERAARAWDSGKFDEEVVPVEVPQRRGDPVVVDRDEEYTNIKPEKIPSLRPAFDREGTVTAANASTINDGAAAMVIMSAEKAAEMGVEPLARIRGFGDAAKEPQEFTTAPAEAVPLALKHAGVSLEDIAYHEINEAFSVVSMANTQILNLDPDRVNVYGGAVALGHPIGCSGARIIGTLMSVLRDNNEALGCASICNGGGGASAVVIENLRRS